MKLKEKEIIADATLSYYYGRIVQWSEMKRCIDQEIDNARKKVMELMGANEHCYDEDGNLMFTYFDQPDYYRINESELKECAPLIYEFHKRLVRGGRRLRVLLPCLEKPDEC